MLFFDSLELGWNQSGTEKIRFPRRIQIHRFVSSGKTVGRSSIMQDFWSWSFPMPLSRSTNSILYSPHYAVLPSQHPSGKWWRKLFLRSISLGRLSLQFFHHSRVSSPPSRSIYSPISVNNTPPFPVAHGWRYFAEWGSAPSDPAGLLRLRLLWTNGNETSSLGENREPINEFSG